MGFLCHRPRNAKSNLHFDCMFLRMPFDAGGHTPQRLLSVYEWKSSNQARRCAISLINPHIRESACSGTALYHEQFPSKTGERIRGIAHLLAWSIELMQLYQEGPHWSCWHDIRRSWRRFSGRCTMIWGHTGLFHVKNLCCRRNPNRANNFSWYSVPGKRPLRFCSQC